MASPEPSHILWELAFNPKPKFIRPLACACVDLRSGASAGLTRHHPLEGAMFAAGSKNQNLLAPLRQQFRQQLLTSGARLSPPSVVSRDPDNLDRYLQKATASLMSWSSSAVVTTARPVAFSHQIRPAKTKSPGEWPGLSIRNRCGNTTTHAEASKNLISPSECGASR
jgi:hypothetical protein